MSRIGMICSAALVSLTGACELDPAPPHDFDLTSPGPDVIRVTEIAVDDTELWGYLEVEVHLYDADTGETLGCTGENEGLDGVDDGGVSYQVLSDFVTPTSEPLLFDDIADRNVIVEVTERDNLDGYSYRCPVPPGDDDDVIGTSEPFVASAFDPALGMAFGDVIDLVIGTSRTLLQ